MPERCPICDEIECAHTSDEKELAHLRAEVRVLKEACSAWSREQGRLMDALSAAEERAENLSWSGVHTCHAQCQKVPCVLRRKLEAAERERDEWKQHAAVGVKVREAEFARLQDTLGQLAAATSERDSMSSALAQMTAERDAARAEAEEAIKQSAYWQCEYLKARDNREIAPPENVTVRCEPCDIGFVTGSDVDIARCPRCEKAVRT